MLSKQKIGIIHPGMMGICVAATIQNSGHEVYWASEGAVRKAANGQKNIVFPMPVHWQACAGLVR